MWSFIKSEQQQLANNKPRVTSTSHIIRPGVRALRIWKLYSRTQTYYDDPSQQQHGWTFWSHSVHPLLRVLLISFALHAMTRPFVRSFFRSTTLVHPIHVMRQRRIANQCHDGLYSFSRWHYGNWLEHPPPFASFQHSTKVTLHFPRLISCRSLSVHGATFADNPTAIQCNVVNGGGEVTLNHPQLMQIKSRSSEVRRYIASMELESLLLRCFETCSTTTTTSQRMGFDFLTPTSNCAPASRPLFVKGCERKVLSPRTPRVRYQGGTRRMELL